MAISATPLLLCYHVWVNPTNGNVTLQEVFTTFRMPEPGARRLPIDVYTLLTGEPGESGTFELEGIEEATGHVYARAEGLVTIGPQGKRHMQIYLDHYYLPRPGEYRFVLRLDRREIAEQVITVREV